jgi:hypothetical protein
MGIKIERAVTAGKAVAEKSYRYREGKVGGRTE